MGEIKVPTKVMDLQNASATQIVNGGETDNWIVYNSSSEKLWEFPSHYTEQEIMAIIKFGRKFELTALNTGANIQKKLYGDTVRKLEAQYKERLELAKAENERLATALEEFIISED